MTISPINLVKLSLEDRLSRLEKVIKVADDGSVIIESNKKISVKAAAIEIEGVATVLIKGGATVEVNGGATLTLKGGAMANLQAAVVRFNNGSHPVARVGSQVIPSMPPFGTVNTGNGTVLA